MSECVLTHVLIQTAKAEWKFGHIPIAKVVNLSTVDVYAPQNIGTSLYHLIETFTRGIHRIPVVNDEGEVVNMASQSSVIRFLAEHMAELGEFGSQKLVTLGVILSPGRVLN